MAEFAPLTDSEVIVLGDLNLDWLTNASKVLKSCHNLHRTQLINEPTHPNLKDMSKSTSIDLIFCNRPDKYLANGVSDLVICDHCPIVNLHSGLDVAKIGLTGDNQKEF